MTLSTLELDDRALADRVAGGGDEAAFRTLYRRHTPYLYQLALRLMKGSEADADDVVQEAWVRAVERLDGFRWEASLRSWVSAIVLNVCRGMFRKKNRDWSVLHPESVPVRRSSEEDRIDLEHAISLLPDGYRAVLVLHDVEGYTHHEIAAHLGITEGTSKSQLFHARRAVRTLLDPPEARMEKNV